MANKGNNGVGRCNTTTICYSLKRWCFMCGLGINDRLNDDMLMQILCRLPVQSAMACKSVCKRWLSLISSPGFISCFISRHDPHLHQQNYLVYQTHGPYFLLSSQLLSSETSFSFLHAASSSETFLFQILASSDDLLLCSSGDGFDLNNTIYFIGNPFTKSWFRIPPPPPRRRLRFGFTCQPYYRVNRDTKCVMVNSRCRFRVVQLQLPRTLIKEPPSMVKLDIFSSETWQWTTTKIHCPFKHPLAYSTSHNGLLYWFCYYGGVVVHDPYNNMVRYVIDPPGDGFSSECFRCSVSSVGSLLAFQQSSRSLDFKVWELEDLDQRQWKLKSAVALREHLLNTCDHFKCASSSSIIPLAFDPNDKDVFFLRCPVGGITSINLRTRVFMARVVPRLPERPYDSRTCSIVQDPSMFSAIYYPLFEIKAPCWPTPTSALFNHASAKSRD